MKKFNYQFYGSHVGRMNYGGAKFCRFALFPLMLLMLLLLPTRMVAQTTTEDPRYALFNGLEGISDVTITDYFGYPWKMLDLKADGMENLGFTFPEGSKVLMSSNYHVNKSFPITLIRFKVSKPILLTSQVLVSSEENCDFFSINVDAKTILFISGKMQTECKILLSAGEHSLTLKYQKNGGGDRYADRAFLYNLKTSTTIDDYVADYESSNNTLTFKKIKSDNLGALDLNRTAMVYNTQRVSEMCCLLGIEASTIKNIVFKENFKTYAPTSLNSFFKDLTSLQTIADLKYLNTANVTDMSDMFCSCEELSSLDLTNFITANVTDMTTMFDGCFALTTIYVSDKFVTGQVTGGSYMFYGCSNLKGYSDSKTDHTYANCGPDGYFTPGCGYAEFDGGTGTLTFRCGLSKPAGAYDLNEGANTPEWRREQFDDNYGSKIDISKVVFDASFANARPTSCYEWFDFCTSLTEIEGIENLNTEEVTNMGSMFSGCYDLTQLDVSNFNTQKVEDMSDMFVSCMALKSLNVSNFDTQKVKDMNDMFYNCNSLTSLDVSNFDTQNVENMSYMFSSCEGLNSLDLSNFDTQKVTNMYGMFWNSSALKTIFVSDKFVTTKVSSGADMFKGCTLLKGAIPEYEDSKTDHTYANYKTGYFSKLVGKNGDEKIGAAGDNLATDNLILADGKDFVAYETFAAKKASYSRTIKEGSKWGTLCLPFAIVQSQETECKFYRFTGIDAANECITLESCEEGIIPAGTPVLFKMNEGVKTLSISAQNTDLVKEPVAGTNTDVNLVGSFTKIGGNGNQGLDKNDYIIGKDKFWLVSDLKDGKGVGIKPMRAYIHPATTSQARAAMLSIGKGDGTTAIDNLNAISNDANAEYYDANGRRTNGLQKGLNIVKRGSKTYKIMVK